jgi:hypothetical protein
VPKIFRLIRAAWCRGIYIGCAGSAWAWGGVATQARKHVEKERRAKDTTISPSEQSNIRPLRAISPTPVDISSSEIIHAKLSLRVRSLANLAAFWEKLGDGPELALTAISTSASIRRVLTGTLIVDSYRNGSIFSGSYPGSLSVSSGPSPLMGRASETLHSMAPHGVPTAIASGYFTMTELVLEA